jgi:hypothetical protein
MVKLSYRAAVCMLFVISGTMTNTYGQFNLQKEFVRILILTGSNGNPASHEVHTASQRMAFNRYCRILVQSDKQAGQIKLKASSEALQSSETFIITKEYEKE